MKYSTDYWSEVSLNRSLAKQIQRAIFLKEQEWEEETKETNTKTCEADERRIPCGEESERKVTGRKSHGEKEKKAGKRNLKEKSRDRELINNDESFDKQTEPIYEHKNEQKKNKKRSPILSHFIPIIMCCEGRGIRN